MVIPTVNFNLTGGAALTGIKATRTSGTNIKVSWDPSTDEYHKRYALYRSDDNFVANSTKIVSTTKTEYVDKDTGVGTWSYMVRDVDEFAQESPDSDIVSVTMAALLPYTNTMDITSATTINFITELERLASSGSIENQGPEDLLVEFSYDGTTYPRSITLRMLDMINISDSKNRIAIHSIKLTSTDSKVNVVAV